MSYLMKVLDKPTQAQLAVVYGTPLLELQTLSVMRGPYYYEQDNVRFWQILMVSVNTAVDCRRQLQPTLQRAMDALHGERLLQLPMVQTQSLPVF
jgi:hypothetical protein